jgi:hypothetical protein
VHAKRSLGLSEVFIHDQEGRLLAHGSSLCFILPSVQLDPGTGEEQVTGSSNAGDDNPDPYERPATGEVLPQEVWDRMSGLEVLEAQITGELPRPPVVTCSV